MKKAFIIQPGKLGDLIVSEPIAKYYNDNGYIVEWLLFDNFVNFINYFSYIKPITFNLKADEKQYYSNRRMDFSDQNSLKMSFDFYKNANIYCENNKKDGDVVLDISWGFPGSSFLNNNLIQQFYKQKRNWIDMRYFLGKTPLKNRWNFTWERNEKKEDELLEFIKKFSLQKYGTEEYSIKHNYKNNLIDVKLKNEINFGYIKGYEILDWYKVLLEAKEIACVDSSLCNFVEVLPSLKNKKKYHLGSEEKHYYEYMRNILLNNWQNHKEENITSDYKEKI